MDDRQAEADTTMQSLASLLEQDDLGSFLRHFREGKGWQDHPFGTNKAYLESVKFSLMGLTNAIETRLDDLYGGNTDKA